MATNSTTAIDNTEIKYSREAREYVVLVDDQPVAWAATYSQAEAKRTAYLADRRYEDE